MLKKYFSFCLGGRPPQLHLTYINHEKVYFSEKKNPGKDRSLQEKLVKSILMTCSLTNSRQASDAGFDRDEVYNRIIGNIDAHAG
jgi:hypothetical protein